jgi:hypothetical protein
LPYLRILELCATKHLFKPSSSSLEVTTHIAQYNIWHKRFYRGVFQPLNQTAPQRGPPSPP